MLGRYGRRHPPWKSSLIQRKCPGSIREIGKASRRVMLAWSVCRIAGIRPKCFTQSRLAHRRPQNSCSNGCQFCWLPHIARARRRSSARGAEEERQDAGMRRLRKEASSTIGTAAMRMASVASAAPTAAPGWGRCARSCIMRAFLVEPRKIARQVPAQKAAALADPDTKSTGKKSKRADGLGRAARTLGSGARGRRLGARRAGASGSKKKHRVV